MRRVVSILCPLLLLAGLSGPTLFADEPAPAPPAPEPAAPSTPAKPDPAETARIEKLVRDLGAADFAAREQARQELLAIGEPAREALERTMKESDDMEARWRAEQILRRLDRQQARPMGSEAPAPQPPAPPGDRQPRPPAMPPVPSPFGGVLPGGPSDPAGLTPAERLFEELMRRMEELGRSGPMLGPDRVLLEAPGLKLQVSTFSILPRVDLRVEGHARGYSGRSLEELLLRYPDLAEHPGMPALEKQWKEHLEHRPSPFAIDPRAPQGSPFRSLFEFRSQGVHITQTPEGVRVKITGTDDQGKETVEEYEGASIPEILEKHPELKDKIGGFHVEFHAPPPRFFGRPGGQRLPLPPAPPPVVTPREPATAEFGVVVEQPEPVLATQLGLPEGKGALVRQVAAGSQAAALGLQRFDVILELDGTVVMDVRHLDLTLREKAAAGAPLTLTVIRRGERVALSR